MRFTGTLKWMLIGGLVAVLAGCTILRVGYSYLDTWAQWTADEYFDLTPLQRDQFRARFERLHAWHRSEQLPDYASFLTAVSSRIRNGLTHEDALWIGSGLEERYRVLIRRSADDAAALLMTMGPEQLESLRARWKKDNARFAREQRLQGTPEEQQAARLKREIERIEEWAGDLSPGQEAKIAGLLKDVPLAPRLRYEDRLRRQRAFLQLMEQRDDPRRFAERLRHYLLNWEEGRDAEYHRIAEEWRRKQAAFYVHVVGMLNTEQRETLHRRLQRYAGDFTQLAQRGGSGAGSSYQKGCPGCPRTSAQ